MKNESFARAKPTNKGGYTHPFYSRVFKSITMTTEEKKKVLNDIAEFIAPQTIYSQVRGSGTRRNVAKIIMGYANHEQFEITIKFTANIGLELILSPTIHFMITHPTVAKKFPKIYINQKEAAQMVGSDRNPIMDIIETFADNGILPTITNTKGSE